ncbi:hypothetical protein [Neisseria sp. Ec49-e6-T10]|uniref:hypothetical protein n=1 Tax=Neisseria sp. Ec49-e6-T10 TaxID=3140744 RepID=UPI003EBC3329
MLLLIGTIMLFIGFLFNYLCPINKKIWSPTFVLVTCGLAIYIIILLIWVIDTKGYKRWATFFVPFGVNPLFIYVTAGVLSNILTKVRFIYHEQFIDMKQFIYITCLQPYFGNYLGSFCFALLFIGLNWLIANILYKKKIYIKL